MLCSIYHSTSAGIPDPIPCCPRCIYEGSSAPAQPVHIGAVSLAALRRSTACQPDRRSVPSAVNFALQSLLP